MSSKRKSTDGAGAKAAKRPTIGNGKEKDAGAAALVADAAAAIKGAKPYVMQVMQHLDEVLNTHGSIDSYLTSKYNTPESLTHLLESINEAFPPMEGHDYSQDLQPGRKLLRPYMVSWLPDLGNKGVCVTDDIKALVGLVAARGFLSDAENLPGVEKLVVAAIPEEYADSVQPFQNLCVPGFELGLSSVALVKGWSRTNALWFVTTTIIENGLLDELKLDDFVYNSFRTVHGICHPYDSLERQVFASREITLASTSTRRRPNAFTWLHQITRLSKAGQSVENSMSRWQEVSSIACALSIGPEEAKAALNLSKHCSASFVSEMRRLVVKYGMFRGPVTHAALASPLVCMGSSVQGTVTPYYQGHLKLDEYSSLLLAKRIGKDYEDLPSTMRRSCGVPELGVLHLRVTGFGLALRLFQATVTPTVYATESPGLEATFLKKYMDHEIEEEIRRGAEFDLSRVSAFKTVMVRNQRLVEAEQHTRQQELEERVAHATLEQMVAHLEWDCKEIDQWKAAASAAARSFETEVLHYKSKRYNRGLEMVAARMQETLHLVDVNSLAEANQHYSVMKNQLLKRRSPDQQWYPYCHPGLQC